MAMYPSAFATVLIAIRQKLFGVATAIAALLIIAPPLTGPLKSRFIEFCANKRTVISHGV
jgi:hypothetical protein